VVGAAWLVRNFKAVLVTQQLESREVEFLRETSRKF
jgi:hypothetical protein